MSNARIQFSLATEDVWQAYNPFLKEGEIVTSFKANKKVKLVQGKIGGSNYSDSTVIWDQDNAESLTSRSETAATTAATKASTAASSASAAAASQAAAANSASAAAASASAAKSSETTAKASETAGANSASAAASSESNAAASAEAAQSAASNAAASATTAVQKATAAAASAETAAAKATAAADSASASNDSAITAGRQATAAANSASAAAASASEATAKVIEATDEANRAKAEADRAKSISDAIGNPVSDVTENNGSVTVTKSDGTQSTFMAFPQGENGALPIADGGTGANNSADACANIGALPTSGGNITGSLSIGGYVVVPCYSNAAAHNAIFRGKHLGDHVTNEQWAAIKAGTFDDLYIGDYWTIGGVDYVIAAFNYYLNCGDTACTANHVTIVPRKNLYNHVMNDTNVVTGAYVGSKMYASGLNSAKTTIANAFGSAHILTIRQLFQNSVTGDYENGYAWYDASVFLMNEINVYGGYVFKSFLHDTGWAYMYSIDNSQYPVFAFDKKMIHTCQDYWLRDVARSSYFCLVDPYGACNVNGASGSRGVRPAFNIYQS